MAKEHVVAAGEWIGAIAHKYGFDHWSTLWNHDDNAEIREARPASGLLMEGDKLNIPEPGGRPGVLVPTSKRHVFTLRGEVDWVKLKVVGIEDFIEEFGPMAYEVKVGDRVLEGVLNVGDDEITVPIVPQDSTIVLSIEGGLRREFDIGDVGPTSEMRGAYERLKNMGFVSERSSGVLTASMEEACRHALRRFQTFCGIACTGDLDEDTAARLEQEYGA